jgi:hypothetical protein
MHAQHVGPELNIVMVLVSIETHLKSSEVEGANVLTVNTVYHGYFGKATGAFKEFMFSTIRTNTGGLFVTD